MWHLNIHKFVAGDFDIAHVVIGVIREFGSCYGIIKKKIATV